MKHATLVSIERLKVRFALILIELKLSSLVVYLLVVQLLNAYISFEHLTQNRVSTTIYIHWKFCVDSSQAHG